ncbi:hypothetical protein MMC17_009413 [Xylographa soralifera]|nr:hypothetical protein [Xylographa soralifera]
MESPSSVNHELILPLRCQVLEDFFFTVLMATVDVDQKFLGQSAKRTGSDNPFLSSVLYKVLGLSVLLTKKLVRARKLRRLDTTRDTKSLQLYHHIIWLSRECLVLVEQYILPMVADYVELKVLAYKLRASLYHNYVLYHNQPSINRTAIPSYTATSNKGKAPERSSLRSSPVFNDSIEGGPVRNQSSLPPGLTPISIPKPSASFLLPATDYIPTASSCFTMAAALADELLPGSHPLRLSVKLEYAAYLYDCLHDGDASRSLARQSIRDVYEAQEGMDDDMFEDAAFLVGYLGKMMKRGLSASGTSGSTPRNGSVATPSTPRARDIPYSDNRIPPAIPNPGTQNPI